MLKDHPGVTQPADERRSRSKTIFKTSLSDMTSLIAPSAQKAEGETLWRSVLEVIVQYEITEFAEEPTFRTALKHKWEQYRWYYFWLNFFPNLMTVTACVLPHPPRARFGRLAGHYISEPLQRLTPAADTPCACTTS